MAVLKHLMDLFEDEEEKIIEKCKKDFYPKGI